MTEHRGLTLIDTHAGGDVSRIVTGGIAPLPGNTVREQMEYLQHHADGLRQLLLFEPYGIPEMSVDLIVPASHPDAAAGYIIMEVMGYPIYSGSNTICTATALLKSGLVPMQEGVQEFKLESPAGLVNIRAKNRGKDVESITIQGLPSYIAAYHEQVRVEGLGDVTYSIAYSGGFYALVDAGELGFKLTLDEEPLLAATAHKIVEAIRAQRDDHHPSLGDVGPLPFLHFMGPETRDGNRTVSRSTTYVHPGVICRSTTGTGTAARLALMAHEGRLDIGNELETVSLRNTRFVGTCTAFSKTGHYPSVDSTITGKAQLLARSEIIVDPEEPLLKDRDFLSLLSVSEYY